MKKLTSLLLAIGVFCATAFTASAQAPLQYRVDDIADLLAITLYGSDAKVVAWVGGNTTRDDGLGGMFYYDGTSSAATNVYAVFKPTNNAGRWFKLPTAVAWQNAAVTVGDDTTYGFKFLRGTGQTNFFGIGADNNITYLQTFNGKNLHINNLGNNTILNATAGNTGVGENSPVSKLSISGTVAASAGNSSYMLRVTGGSVTGNANQNIGLARIDGTVVEAASGTHTRISGLDLFPPTITGGAGMVQDQATLYVSDAPAGTVAGITAALWVDSGAARFDGDITAIGNTVTFGNGEVINNSVDGTVAVTDGSNTLATFVDAGTTGNFTSSGTITATAGAITASNGNVVLGTAGNGLQIKEGSNARMGTATLSGGTIAVSNTSAVTGDRIFITRVSGTAAEFGHLSYTINTGVSFTINSTDAQDDSVVNWLIIKPTP